MKKEIENWKRLKLVLNTSGKFVLRKLLLTKFMNDEMILRTLQRPGVKRKFEKAYQKGTMSSRQWNILYVQTQQYEEKDKLNTKNIDVELYALLLQKLAELQTPKHGWHDWPSENDFSVTANVVRIKLMYREVNHMTRVDDEDFEKKWAMLKSSLIALNYSKYAIDNLRTCAIEPDWNISYFWYHIVNSPELHRTELIIAMVVMFLLLCIVDTREYIIDVLHRALHFVMWQYYKYFGNKSSSKN